jgi:glucosyl-3-phosphoglycerate synthase
MNFGTTNHSSGDTQTFVVSEHEVDRLKLGQSVCLAIPAHNEEKTIGALLDDILESWLWSNRLVDEILVIDDRSDDRTAEEATRRGIRVVSTEDHCRRMGGSRGKGDAIWCSLRETSANFMVWIDGDVVDFDPSVIFRLIQPLLDDSSLALVKGSFTRLHAGVPTPGGRLTLLTAFPLLELLLPEATDLREPLGGFFAAPRRVIGSLWLDSDYGVDIGIVIDVLNLFGRSSIQEVDLGTIEHTPRDLKSLSGSATMIARAILSRTVSPLLYEETPDIGTLLSADVESRRRPALSVGLSGTHAP